VVGLPTAGLLKAPDFSQGKFTYRRLIELEVRLLEKEWNGEGNLFAQLIVR